MHRINGDSADIDRFRPRALSRDDAQVASPHAETGCQQSNDDVIGCIVNRCGGHPDLDSAVVNANDLACACPRSHQDSESAAAGPLLDWFGGSVSFNHGTSMILPRGRELGTLPRKPRLEGGGGTRAGGWGRGEEPDRVPRCAGEVGFLLARPLSKSRPLAKCNPIGDSRTLVAATSRRPDLRGVTSSDVYPLMMEFVEITHEDSVALVRLNRPPVNALSEAFADELRQAFDSVAGPSIRAVVVTGRPHFAAGGDIKGFQETYDQAGEERTGWAIQRAIVALENLPKPTIAAIHGYALGGGLELALGCDFRYLAEDATVGQPEILLGIIPGAGGTQRLPRVVGYQRAKEMIFSGREVGAEEALQTGLADKVVPSDDLLGLAMADARGWATKATLAIAAVKKSLDQGSALPVAEGILVEQTAFQESFATEDAREGVAAFIAKRPGEFKGR